jgi:hypothetical protein
MRQSVIGGLVLAAVIGLLVLLSDPLGLNVEHVALLGIGTGAVLGLIGDRDVWERVSAFAIGLVATWVTYGLRAGFLPDAPSGRAVAFVGLLVFLVFVAWVAAGRLPLWAMLLGVVALAGAYEFTYTEAPPRFMAESPVALTSVLLVVAIGFVVATVVEILPISGDGRYRGRSAEPTDGDDGAEAITEEDVHLDDMLRPAEEARQ